MKRNRLLLPAAGDEQRTEQTEPLPKTRRVPRRLPSNACDGCRSRKVRCDGNRPSCASCLRLDIRCIYAADTKTETAALQQSRHDLLRLLQAASEADALDLFHRLRASRSPLSVIASLQGDMQAKYRPSAIMTARSMSSPTVSALEFELSVRHSLPYPQIPPADLSKISLAPLKPSVESNSHAQYCDDRLGQLDIGYWTTVSMENQVAARVISTYLTSNHPIWGLFHADLFVRDLVAKTDDFCSSFLANAVLLYACQIYGAIDPDVPLLKGLFAAETMKLWSTERSADSPLTLAAILMFSLSCHTFSCGVSLADLLDDARCMAERLQLFGVSDETLLQARFSALTEDQKRATAHVAWGAYGWMTINLNYTAIVAPISFPPLFSIPGTTIDDADENGARGALRVVDRLPPYYGRTFTSLCEFWVIMQSIGQVVRRGHNAAADVPVAFLEQKFQELLHWADGLGDQMTADDRNPDAVIVFHMFFHCAILDLFLPFYNSPQPLRLFSFSARDSSPRTICRASVDQLKHLLAVCRQSRHLVLTSNSTAAIVHLCHAMIREGSAARAQQQHPTSSPPDANEGEDAKEADNTLPPTQPPLDPDWHFYLLLCLASCQDMLLCFDLAAPLLRGLLTMGLRDGAMSASEARALVGKLESRARMQPAEVVAHGIVGDVLLDLGLALTAPEEAQIRNMSEMFDSLLAFEEFIVNEDCGG